MKKTYSSFFLLLVILLLSGCSCKHQWYTTTCISAEMCSQCGQLQGTAQEQHSFSDWEAGEGLNTRTCLFCSFQEIEIIPEETVPLVTESTTQPTEEIDLRMKPNHIGLWTSKWAEYNFLEWSGRQTYRQLGTAYSLELFADGTYTANLFDGTSNGQWQISDIDPDSGTIFCSTDSSEMYFSISSDGELILSDYRIMNDQYCFAQLEDSEKAELEKEIEDLNQLPLGTWTSYLQISQHDISGSVDCYPHTACTVTFSADGTIHYSMPEWGEEHIVESNWYAANIHQDRTGTTYQFDFVDSDTSYSKHFFITGFYQETMYLEYPGNNQLIRIYLKKQEDE